MFLLTCKLIFVTTLAIIFLKFFGHPSYIKYQKEGTVFTETKVRNDQTKPPAITIFTWSGVIFNGWKNASYVTYSLNSENFCNVSDTFDKFVWCINEKTFKRDDVILWANDGNNNILNESFWAEEITTFYAGKSYSLQYIAFQSEDKFDVHFGLKKGQNYSIIIHDPNYYLFTVNPETIPNIILTMDDSKSQIVSLKAIYHQIMNKPEQPCESSESYSFTACIKNSITRRVGCRLEWDSWSSTDIPLCTMVEQLLQYEKEYHDFWDIDESTVLNETGCIPPCRYTEYKLSAEPLKYQWNGKGIQWSRKGLHLRVKFSSNKGLKRTEELLYPIESFVSEFGGALGLFVGFSFMMVWDVIDLLLHVWLKSKPNA